MDQVDAMEALAKPDQSLLSFHVSAAPGAYLAQAFASFAKGLEREKPLDIAFRETGSSQVLARVESGLDRLGIIRCLVAEAAGLERRLANLGLAARPLWRFRQKLLLFARHPLARQQRISPEDLAACTCIYNEELLRCEAVGEEGRPEGSRLLVIDRQSQYQLLKQLPDSYAWSPPLPPALLAREQLAQMDCPALAPVCQDLLIYSQAYSLSSLDEAFLNAALAARAALSPGETS